MPNEHVNMFLQTIRQEVSVLIEFRFIRLFRCE